MKTVWFINPPDSWAEKAGDRPPLGIASLSAYLKKAGHITKIFDCNLGHNPTLKEVIVGKPDYICISIATPNYQKAIEMANVFKKMKLEKRHLFSNKLRLIAGGPHVAAYPDEEMSIKTFDYIVTGTDGEEGLLRIINKHPREQIIKSMDIEKLDTLPYPDYEGLEMDKYNMTIEGKKAITISTSRGCIYGCFYCGSATIKKVRNHSAEYVVNHMKRLYDTCQIRGFYFVDDIFTNNFARVFEICRLIGLASFNDISIRATTRANLLTQELCYSMKTAGFDIISIGLESGSDKVLKAMLKHETVEIQRKGVEYCYNAGIKVKGFFIIGNPEETWEDVLMTIAFAKELADKKMIQYADCYILNPIPASPFWKEPAKFGIEYKKPIDHNWNEYYQIGKGRDIKVNIKHPYLTEEQLKDGIELFYKEIQVPGLTYK